MFPLIPHTTGLEITNQKLKRLLHILIESTYKCFVQVVLTDMLLEISQIIEFYLQEGMIAGFKNSFTIINASRSSIAITMNEKHVTHCLPIA